MATVRCTMGRRGRATHEWNDGTKDRVYCYGYIDLMTAEPSAECIRCRDHVSHAQEDYDKWRKEQDDA